MTKPARGKKQKQEAQMAQLSAVFDGVVGLFHELRHAAEQVHGQGEISAGRRGILRSLAQEGMLTVPQLARSRHVTRQHIQTIANVLLEEGLVEYVENPAHKRSKLLRLTKAGKDALVALLEAENQLFLQFDWPVTTEELEQTSAVLQRLWQFFQSPEWSARRQNSETRE